MAEEVVLSSFRPCDKVLIVKRYDPKQVESKWRQYWEENQTYKADLNSSKPKYIAMSMFNYPSGDGIHIGHALNYTISDVMARFKRQQGYESYHPIGWDSFGLPAENYAIKAGVSPQKSMARIIPSFHKQYKAMGWSNDWSKEISTHEPTYYKWTQWIFSQMYKNGLAYQDARMQWWCDKCQTVLANEQIEASGKCWRHDGPDDAVVTKKEVKQWFFKITDYADELLAATDDLDWTDSVKQAQKNWIGKSLGAEVKFKIQNSKFEIKVFTTRPDTIYGATFLVVAPEHEILNKLSIDSNQAVSDYIKAATAKTEVERQASKDKTGVFSGVYAINPANNEKIPIWIADYVLVGYGTGAIMAVPAHDERDYEFAKKFDLEIRQVVMPLDIDSINPPQTGFEMIERPTVIVHLQDKSSGKFALLDWHESLEGITTGIMGGIEDGQTPEEAALNEIKEEAALENVRIIDRLEWVTAAEYCASHKQQNRRAITHVLLAEVDSLESQGEISANETKNHTLVWVEKEKVLDRITPDHQKQVWEMLWRPGCLAGEGVLINSGKYDRLPASEAREKIVADLAKTGAAEAKTIYKIRDWSVTRQRYWGAPTPIIYCAGCGPVLVPDDQLPVLLPELEDFAPSGDGRSALARATEWLKVDCPKCGGQAERETDTLDTYICSSWYMLRYFDPTNDKAIFDTQTVNKWAPIDFYNGADHATAHMIYARFVTRFFHKQGLIDHPEPFKRFLFNGKVTASNGEMFSKSKGNGVDPLEIIDQGYGADALRTYLMFAAPLDTWVKWDPQGVPGAYRFINRVWNLVESFVEAKDVTEAENQAIRYAIHPAIQKVSADLEDQKYNTAIATLMKACNDLYLLSAKGFVGHQDWRWALESLIQMMAPFAPHTAEELWHTLGHEDSVQVDHWPVHDAQYLTKDTITIAVQVNGKLRATVDVATEADEQEVIFAAKQSEKITPHLEAKTIVKEIYIKGRLVNLVVK
jgi:leucyl-tRNA synthetase